MTGLQWRHALIQDTTLIIITLFNVSLAPYSCPDCTWDKKLNYVQTINQTETKTELHPISDSSTRGYDIDWDGHKFNMKADFFNTFDKYLISQANGIKLRRVTQMTQQEAIPWKIIT
jgi:hypothetical protein